MTDPLAPPPRNPPRFVPTLTEVVPLHQLSPMADPQDLRPEISQEFLDEVVDQAFRRAEASLAQRLPEVLSVILHEQALALSETLRREIKTSVRQTVTNVLAERLPAVRVRPSPRSEAGIDAPAGRRVE